MRKLCGALGTIKAYYDYGMFRPMQIAAIMALRHGESAVEAQSKEYQRRRDVLCDGLKRIGWDVTPPRASMFVWAKIPEPWAKMGSLDFAMKLLEEADVVVSPGAGFGPAGEGYVADRADRKRKPHPPGGSQHRASDRNGTEKRLDHPRFHWGAASSCGGNLRITPRQSRGLIVRRVS